MIAIAVIFGAGGFYGGMQYANSSAASQKSSRFGGAGGGNYAAMRGGQGAGRGGAAMGGANGNGGFITGQITAVSGSSITVQERDGSSKIVLYSGSTAVGKTVSGSVSDLAAGDNVMITGAANSDGSVTAQSIQIRPAAPNTNGTPANPSGGSTSNSGN